MRSYSQSRSHLNSYISDESTDLQNKVHKQYLKLLEKNSELDNHISCISTISIHLTQYRLIEEY
jgi:hypothetical protein